MAPRVMRVAGLATAPPPPPPPFERLRELLCDCLSDCCPVKGKGHQLTESTSVWEICRSSRSQEEGRLPRWSRPPLGLPLGLPPALRCLALQYRLRAALDEAW